MFAQVSKLKIYFIHNSISIMDFDLKRAKEYEMSSQLLVFGYCREIYVDAPDLILYTILMLYHQTEHFESFLDSEFAVDDTKMTITKKKTGWTGTAYGSIPMLCDGIHSGVYVFELKVYTYFGTVGSWAF